MDRNLWTAIALSAGVYALWFGVVDKRVNPPAPRPAPEAAPAAATPPAAAPAPSPEQRDARRAEPFSVRLGEVAALLSPRGAAIASFPYPGPLGRVELVASPDPGLFATWPELTFRRDPAVPGVACAATRSDGLRILKEFLPGSDGVLPRLRLTALNPTQRALDVGPWTLTVGPGLGTVPSEEKENADLLRAIGLTPEDGGLNGRVEVFKKPGPQAGPHRWVGVDNRYFLAALLPDFTRFEPVSSALPPALTLTAKPVLLAPDARAAWEIPYYLGPKAQGPLAVYKAGLDRAIDFGFFSQLGRAMMSALDRLYRATGNWGWSIVVLTLALQILLFPLTWKSLKAAAAMRRLQPEIARLQQRHAGDAQALNAEMMALYKRTGANPLSGCLPMVLQMPVFLALYNALRGSWDLHGAPWIFWIKDLSAKDPYYALPLVMGALMYAQSKLNPPSSDPSQRTIMMLMPVIFTVMFLNFPSGLVLYWLMNSLVSAGLQFALQDRLNADSR